MTRFLLLVILMCCTSVMLAFLWFLFDALHSDKQPQQQLNIQIVAKYKECDVVRIYMPDLAESFHALYCPK